MSARVLRWTVPIDGQSHEIGGGDVVLVGDQSSVCELAVWTLELLATPAPPRRVAVFAEVSDIDVRWRHLGSFLVTPGHFVWHVFEVGDDG